MKTVKHLLKIKGEQVWSVSPDTPVYEALRLMADRDAGAVMVLERDQICGIFTERDYARKVILKGRFSKDLPVGEVMTTDLVTVQPGQTIAECMQLMSKRHIRHLPVLDGKKLAGLISIRDVMEAIISQQQEDIQRLEGYMMGGEDSLLA